MQGGFIMTQAEMMAKIKGDENQAKQIVEMAKAAAESEGQSIIQQVRATIADELIEATREQLIASLNKKSHEQLIDKSLEKVVLQ